MLKRFVRAFLIVGCSSVVWLPVVLHLIGHDPPIFINVFKSVIVVIEPLTRETLVWGIILTGLAIFLTSPRKRVEEEEA